MTSDDLYQHAADRPDSDRFSMRADQRQTRLPAGSEKELLEAFLDYHRDTLLWKVSGLTDAQLRKIWTPSGLSLLGLVKHLAHVEHNWFQGGFLGRGLMAPGTDEDPDPDFRIEPDDTIASIITLYRDKVAESRQIVAETDSLDTVARYPNRPYALRRIMMHLLEETARHNGHADVMRELTDGQTGE